MCIGKSEIVPHVKGREDVNDLKYLWFHQYFELHELYSQKIKTIVYVLDLLVWPLKLFQIMVQFTQT